MKLVGCCALLAALGAGSAWSQLEIKLGHPGSPGSLLSVSAEEYARRANAKLAGRANVVVSGSSKLGSDTELLQKLKLGTVELAMPGSVMSSESDLFGMFELPYLVKNRAHLRALEREIIWPHLAPDVEKKGLKVLAVWENGYRHITNNRKPIVQPADLEGLKLRVPEGKWRVKMFRAYGANPGPLKPSEMRAALETGVMDGQENPFSNIYAGKLYEVQKFLSISGHVYTPAFLTAGAEKWRELPAEVRSILESEAKAHQAFVHATAEREEHDLLDKLRKAGMQVNEVDKGAFVRASRSIYDEFAAEVPGARELVEIALRLAE